MAREYQPEQIRANLLYLRKGAGCTPARLLRCGPLVSVLGGRSEPTEVLIERLESAIGSLDDSDTDLLLSVYALTEEAAELTTLAERRDAVAARLGIGREAVADRDAAGVEALLTQLLTGWYPKSPTGIRIPESHNGFVLHAMHLTTLVRDRRHLETRHHYRLFALFDGVEYLAVAAATPEPPVVIGGDFTVRVVPAERGYMHQFWHRVPMQRGKTYDLRYRVVNPNPDEVYLLTEESLALHEPTRFASFEVIFLGALPEAVWKVQGLTAAERPGVPTKSQLLSFRGSSTVKAQFHDLYGGLFHGIAWDW